MGLSCSCDAWGYGANWTYFPPEDYTTTPKHGRQRKRCCSCKDQIDRGSIGVVFKRVCGPRSDIEAAIHGDDGDVPLADWWMCERCSDLYWSLEELGFCIMLGDDMRKLVKEYAEMNK